MPPRKRFFPRTARPLPAPAVPRERRDLDAVRDIVHAAVIGESAEEALQFALDRVAPLLGAALGSVYLMDGASELMRLVAAHQWPDKYRPWLGDMRVRVGFGPSGEAASERRVIDVPDVFADPDLEDWHEVARELGFVAITALPLIAAGRLLGVATFYFRSASEVDREARQLLRLVADLLASTTDQAARRDELRRVKAALGESTSELEQQFAALGTAHRARDEFLESVAQELGTPLAGLLGNLSLLEHEVSGPLTGPQKEEIRAVREAANRMMNLVEALNDLAGARRGSLELLREEFDPRVPMRDAVRDLVSPPGDVTVAVVEPVLALPPMQGDRRKIVRLLVSLMEHVLGRTWSDRIEVTVDAVNGRVRYRVQEAGGRSASSGAAGGTTPGAAPSGSSSREAPQPSWALDLARGVSRLMGGSVSADAVGEGRMAFVLDLPLDGPPPGADAARG